MHKNKPDYIAAVDLGSNSFHMIVVKVDDVGTISVVDDLRESVRLGNGFDKKGNLTKESIERALSCLKRFAQRIRNFPKGAVRIVGTNTLRLAKNAPEFLSAAGHIMGHPIEVIAGREEARLIYLGVARGRAAAESKRLVVDIGGGSTEFIIGEGIQSLLRESVQAGCVSFTRDFFADGSISSTAMKKAIIKAKLAFYPIAYKFCSDNWDGAIGCSGTIKAIRNISHAQGWCSHGINRTALYKMRDHLLAAGHTDKIELKSLVEDRKVILPAGLAVLIAVFETLNIERIKVSEQSLREGLVYDIIGRIKHEDARYMTVISVAKRWSIDTQQAKMVEQTSHRLFDFAKKKWKLKPNDKNMLSWASMLHEIGLQVSHNGYHVHGAYILTHADLPGFSRPEQALLATLVRNHRRKFKLKDFKKINANKTDKRLAVLLRLAVLFHRSRTLEKMEDFTLKVDGKKLNLALDKVWLENHSLSYFDLQTESTLLKKADFDLVVG